MILRAVLTALAVPPANLPLLAGAGLLGVRRRAGRWLAALSVAALILLSLPAIADRLLVSLERGLHPQAPAAPPAAIVVLGGDLEANPNSPLHADPGRFSMERVRAGAALARRTGLPVLITGGMVLRGAAPVATVMADSMRRDFGVPVRWVEDHSADTWQNAQDTAKMLTGTGIRSVLLVTNAWHMRRAMIAFAQTGLAVAPAPVRQDRPAPWSLRNLLPSARAWETSYDALHEWIGCGWYAYVAWLRHD